MRRRGTSVRDSRATQRAQRMRKNSRVFCGFAFAVRRARACCRVQPGRRDDAAHTLPRPPKRVRIEMLATGSMARRTSRFARKCANFVGAANAESRYRRRVRDVFEGDCDAAARDSKSHRQRLAQIGIESLCMHPCDRPSGCMQAAFPARKNKTGRTWRPVFDACRAWATAPAQSCSSSSSA